MVVISTDNLLKKIYYDVETGYIGAVSLLKKALRVKKEITLDEVKQWLASQETFQTTKINHVGKREYLPIYSKTPDNYQIDLAFLYKFKSVNKGYDVILTCVNINTRKAYAYKAKSKAETFENIERFLKDAKPKTITTDQGSEFTNNKVLALFEKHGIEIFLATPGDKHKMGKIERFNRTLKERLNKYFNDLGSPIWYNVLDKVIDNYNNTVHSAIGKTPNEMTQEDELKHIEDMRIKTDDILQRREDLGHVFNVDDSVRVKLKRQIFDKGEPTYSSTVHKIKDINPRTLSVVLDNDKTYKYEDVMVIDPEKLTRNRVFHNDVDEVKADARAKRRLRREGLE